MNVYDLSTSSYKPTTTQSKHKWFKVETDTISEPPPDNSDIIDGDYSGSGADIKVLPTRTTSVTPRQSNNQPTTTYIQAGSNQDDDFVFTDESGSTQGKTTSRAFGETCPKLCSA